jgi:hypothetical protein
LETLVEVFTQVPAQQAFGLLQVLLAQHACPVPPHEVQSPF